MAHTDVYLYPDATLKYHDAIIIFMLLSMFLYEQLLDIRTRCYTSVYSLFRPSLVNFRYIYIQVLAFDSHVKWLTSVTYIYTSPGI